jgi:hypothetical protein
MQAAAFLDEHQLPSHVNLSSFKEEIPFDYSKRRLGYTCFLFLLQFCVNEIRIR